jgi:hypothetical protein
VSNYERRGSLFEAVISIDNIFAEAQYICVSALCSGADVSTAETRGTGSRHHDCRRCRRNVTNSMELSPSWETIGRSASPELPQPEGSLPCSQEPSTGPYHEPD